MKRVFEFLKLAPFDITIEQAHNTHLARSVHVEQDGASDLAEVSAHSLSNEIGFRTQCILHEFFTPFQLELDALLAEHSYPPMRWDTGGKDGRHCPAAYRHWPSSVPRELGDDVGGDADQTMAEAARPSKRAGRSRPKRSSRAKDAD